MGDISNWRQEKHPDFLLIGNSIVLGGNPINHDDKLGPLWEKELGAGSTVSPRAVGPMSMRWCISIAIQMSCKTPIVEYMGGGLAGANPWPGYYVFPDHKPGC